MMSPDDYNADQIDSGFMTTDHITDLVRSSQACEGLTVEPSIFCVYVHDGV